MAFSETSEGWSPPTASAKHERQSMSFLNAFDSDHDNRSTRKLQLNLKRYRAEISSWKLLTMRHNLKSGRGLNLDLIVRFFNETCYFLEGTVGKMVTFWIWLQGSKLLIGRNSSFNSVGKGEWCCEFKNLMLFLQRVKILLYILKWKCKHSLSSPWQISVSGADWKPLVRKIWQWIANKHANILQTIENQDTKGF